MLVPRAERFPARRRVPVVSRSWAAAACQDARGTNQRPSISQWLTTVAPPRLASCEEGVP